MPNLTELTFALGAGNQVAGVSDFCRYPPEALKRPSVGGLVNPGLESTLKLRPTVVLLYRSQTDFAAKLTQVGVRSELFQVDTLSDLYTAIERVGSITGKTSAAVHLAADIQSRLAAVKNAGGKKVKESFLSGILIVSRDKDALRGIYQATSAHFLGELFEMAGGRIAVAGGAAVSREEIIRANPAVIIDMSESGESASLVPGKAIRSTGPWSELSTVQAVKTAHVYTWADPHALLLGPSVVDTAQQMQRLVESASTN